MCVPRTQQSPRKHRAPSLRPEQPALELAEKKPSESAFLLSSGQNHAHFSSFVKKFSFLFKTFAKKINSA